MKKWRKYLGREYTGHTFEDEGWDRFAVVDLLIARGDHPSILVFPVVAGEADYENAEHMAEHEDCWTPVKPRCFITFGQIHSHVIPNHPTFDKDSVAIVRDRGHAFELFGPKWCMCYANPWDLDMSLFPRGYIRVT